MRLQYDWSSNGFFDAAHVGQFEGVKATTKRASSQERTHKGPKAIRQHSRHQVGQLGEARNSRPAPEVVKVVGTFVEEINNRARVPTTVGAVG